jgi:hypothetical protein
MNERRARLTEDRIEIRIRGGMRSGGPVYLPETDRAAWHGRQRQVLSGQSGWTLP